jgi:hypothetical protein
MIKLLFLIFVYARLINLIFFTKSIKKFGVIPDINVYPLNDLLDQRDNKGWTPLELARQIGYEEGERLLMEASAANNEN